MTVQYTENLGLNKPDTEHKPWDIELQTGQDLVDEAVSGYTVQALDADGVTDLTITDGVTSPIRHKIIEFTGALTADEVVNVPAIQKSWMIYNNTTGLFNTIIQVTGGGGLSVTLAPGEIKAVICDSTDVRLEVNLATQLGKNVIINGSMRFDQRETAAAFVGIPNTDVSTFSVDRFKVRSNLSGGTALGLTAEQESATPPEGFEHYLHLNVTTAHSAKIAGDRVFVDHIIEGFNSSRFGLGETWAKSMTLQFKVRSNQAGNYVFSLLNDTGAILYAHKYNIASANIWQTIVVHVPGPTAGTFLKSNGIGLICRWTLDAGSDFDGTVFNEWSASAKIGISDGVDWSETVSNTFDISGVQLEFGNVATAFEWLGFTTELRQCRRYFERRVAGVTAGVLAWGTETSTTVCDLQWQMEVTKRATPTFSVGPNADGSSLRWLAGTGGNAAITAFTANIAVAKTSKHVCQGRFTTTGTAGGNCGTLYDAAAGAGFLQADSEL